MTSLGYVGPFIAPPAIGRAARTHRRAAVTRCAPHPSRAPIVGHAALWHGTRAWRMRRVCASAPQQQDPRTMGGKTHWWEDLEDPDNGGFDELTAEEVDTRVDEAAGLISVLDDVRPVDARKYNAFAEVWSRIGRIPPEARPRLLDEIEPGGIRSLWRASMSRYVLDDARALQLLEGYSLAEDMPQAPGQVVSYGGRCERFEYQPADVGFEVDTSRQDKYPRSRPWLRPAPGRLMLPQSRFTQHFFLHPRTSALHARVSLPLAGPLERWWTPCYCRVRAELTLTPVESDAGADLTFEYPNLRPEQQVVHAALQQARAQGLNLSGAGGLGGGLGVLGSEGQGPANVGLDWDLFSADLPADGWPAPTLDMWSPFSSSSRDYVRVSGPGVYVGCAYLPGPLGKPSKDDCVFFMLVRTP